MANLPADLPHEDGVAAWLRYATLPAAQRTASNSPRIDTILVLLDPHTKDSSDSPVATAGRELTDGLRSILGQSATVTTQTSLPAPSAEAALVVGTRSAVVAAGGAIPAASQPFLEHDEGYWIEAPGTDTPRMIVGCDERGVLYGAFAFLSELAQGTLSASASWGSRPSAPLRWINQWDNMDGSIERGYGGRSLFFEDGRVVDGAEDMARVRQYARLAASVGLNGLVVNNVNANPSLLEDDNLAGVGRLADAMRPYGVRVGLALNFDAPRTLGGLATSDPLDAGVVAWWTEVTARVYRHVPDMLGYTIKANSEGQPGPLSYGRTLADGANLFARALAPHGGLVLYRAFVYDHHLREDNPRNDRANAAVNFFAPLDTQDAFADNVVVQVKFGPIDFQVREPPSPLLAALHHTRFVVEFMVAQEYLGQQSHAVYQAPEWKTILDFDMRLDGADGPPCTVGRLLSPAGPRLGRGYAAVVNVGRDRTWLGHHMAMANLYAYGRLAWDPTQDARALLDAWTRLTWSPDPRVVRVVGDLLMDTWPAYEGHSGNLGVQTLCDILYTHYGPSPASQDGNGWGQWTRADGQGIGMDRTVATGTGFAGQYPPAVAAVFESLATTPDDLLLWFHHVPYTHVLLSGRTVIQHFYDAHYDGAATVQTYPGRWAQLRGRVDAARFDHVAFKLAYQAGHALVWRDSVCRFYRALSGIPDERGRVGHYVYRVPLATSPRVRLDGYVPVGVTPPEAASDGRAVQTGSSTDAARVSFVVDADADAALHKSAGKEGVDDVDVAVNYYDTLGGTSAYELFVNATRVGAWKGNLRERLGHDFSAFLDGHSATRVVFRGVRLVPGDTLSILGKPDGEERAPLDYVSILPAGVVD